MESHWNQFYEMEHQWIQCCKEWNYTEVNVIECNISAFNAIMNGIPLMSILLNGTSMSSMLSRMESH
jgi:hypothetical protein